MPMSMLHLDKEDVYLDQEHPTGTQYGTIQTDGLAATVSDSHKSRYVDDILSDIGFGPFHVLVFSLVGLSYLAFAFEVLTFTFINLEISNLWNLTSLRFSILPATTCVTNLIGGPSFSYLSDQYGRVWPYALTATIAAVFILASAFSPNFIVLVVLRGLASIGVGGLIDLPFPTLVEFLPIKHRGSMSLLVGFVQAVGSCIGGGLAWWLVPSYSNGWRYFIIVTSVPMFLVALFRLLLYVESPRYLVSQSKLNRAWKTLSLIAHLNGKDINTLVEKASFYNKLDSKSTDTTHNAKLHNFLCIFKPPYLRRTICFSVAYVILSLTYLGSVLFLPNLAKNLALPPYLAAFGGFAAQIPGTLLVAIIIEWPCFGRLNTLRIFSASSSLFYFLFAFIQHPVAVSVFIVILYFFMNPTMFLLLTYVSESYPTNIRAMAMAFITATYAVNGIWLPFVGGYMADLSVQYPWLSPAVWGSALAIQFFVTLFLNHETRNRNLQDNIITQNS